MRRSTVPPSVGVGALPAAEAACAAAVRSIVVSGGYASFSAVCAAASASLGLPSFETIGVRSESIGVLAHLWDIEAAVGSYTAGFLATHAIGCVAELEEEVVALLHARGVPALVRQQSNGCLLAAPQSEEEIDIQSDEEEVVDGRAEGEAGAEASMASTPSGGRCFDSFGVGPLALHPAVYARWHPVARGSRIRFSDVAPHLIDFMTQRGASSRGCPQTARGAPDLDPAELGVWLESRLGTSLASLGVVLVPSALPATARAMSFAVHASAEAEARAVRRALDSLYEEHRQQKMHERRMRADRWCGLDVGSRAVPAADRTREGVLGCEGPSKDQAADGTGEEMTAKAGTAAAERRFDTCPIELLPPSNPRVAAWLSSLRVAVGANAPTWSAALAAIRGLRRPRPSEERAGKKRRRREGRMHAEDRISNVDDTVGDVITDETLLLIATEYAMLQLGRSRWRAKRWATSQAEKATDCGAMAESTSSESGSESGSGEKSEFTSNERTSDAVDAESGEGADVKGVENAPDSVDPVRLTPLASAAIVQSTVAGQCASAIGSGEICAGAAVVTQSSGNTRSNTDPTSAAESTTCARACGAAAPAGSGDSMRSSNISDSEEVSQIERSVTTHVSVRPVDAAAAPLSARMHRPVAALAYGKSCSHDAAAGVSHLAGAQLGERLMPWCGTLRLPHSQPLGVALQAGQGSGHSPKRGGATKAADVDLKAVGRWGEALVYAYLLASLPPTRRVEWLNLDEETRAPYDLKITDRHTGRASDPSSLPGHACSGEACGMAPRCDAGVPSLAGGGRGTVFVEVKTTRFYDNNVFEISWAEWEFISREPPVRYHIYRVNGAWESMGPRITIITDPLRSVKEGRIRLCMAI